MKRIHKVGGSILSVILAVLMIVSYAEPALAVTETITNSTDSRINQMLATIDNQNFTGSGTDATTVKAKIKYLMSDSKWNAINGEGFPYPNSGYGKIGTINDGVYSFAINWACAGCYAYADYVSGIVYGKTGSGATEKQTHSVDSLRSLLQAQGQAGEHIRIDGKHSLAFISCTDDGFYALEYTGDSTQKIRLSCWTYKDFLDKYGNSKIWLYNSANTAVNSDVGNNGSTITPSTKPAAPTGLTAVKSSESTARISWNTVSGATSYEVQYYNRSSGTWKTDTDYTNKSATAYTTTGLSLYDSYRFQVRAVNSAGSSSWVEVTYTKPTTTSKTYTVTYNANGGSGAPASQTKTENVDLQLSSSKPTRSGYTFEGWGTSSNSTTISYAAGATYKNNAGITLYAIWKTATLSVLSTEEGSYTVTIPANYTLACYQTPSATARYTYMSAKSASYNLNCTKRLSMSDGSTRYFFVSGDNKECYFVYTSAMTVTGSSTTQPTSLPKPSVSVSGSNVSVSWTAIPNSNQLDIYLILVDEGSTNGTIIERVSAKSITTHTFSNLSNGNYSVQLTTNLYSSGISSERTVFSIAPAGIVTIQYNANGGTGAPSSHNVTKDSNGNAVFNLSTTKPTRSGYDFVGWRLDNSAANSIASPGQSVSIHFSTVAGNTALTYYAQWETESQSSSGEVRTTYFSDGARLDTVYGADGVKISQTRYYPPNNTNIYSVTLFYPDGKTSRKHTIYYESGAIWEEYEYSASGERTKRIIYNADGTIKIIGP